MSASAHADHAVGRIAVSSLFPAVLSIGAGVIHAAVVPEHLAEYWVFGAFFILTAVFQLAWAVVVVRRPSAIVYTAGALINGAIIALWALSRTIGLPIGPEAWMPEPVSTVDVAATLMEVLLVVSVVLARGPVLTAGYRPTTDRPSRLVRFIAHGLREDEGRDESAAGLQQRARDCECPPRVDEVVDQ